MSMNDLIKQFAIDCAGQKEWDFPKDPKSYTFTPDELEKFVALVAEQEREECAKVADAWQTEVLNPRYHCDCATAIRRRGD